MEFGSLFCRLGLHAFEVVETQSDSDESDEVLDGSSTETSFTVRCRRCNVSEIRRPVSVHPAMWH
jgi:hypothetical protein